MLMSNNMYVYIYIQPYVILCIYIYYSISYLNLFTIYSHRFSDMRITSNNPFLGHAISICAQALALTPHFSFTSLANLEAVRIDGAESWAIAVPRSRRNVFTHGSARIFDVLTRKGRLEIRSTSLRRSTVFKTQSHQLHTADVNHTLWMANPTGVLRPNKRTSDSCVISLWSALLCRPSEKCIRRRKFWWFLL